MLTHLKAEGLEAGVARATEAAEKLGHVLRLAQEGTFDLPLLLGVRHLVQEYSEGLASHEAKGFSNALESVASDLYKEIKASASRQKIAFLGRSAGSVLDRMLSILPQGRSAALKSRTA